MLLIQQIFIYVEVQIIQGIIHVNDRIYFSSVLFQCVYAHDKSELRRQKSKKNKKKVSISQDNETDGASVIHSSPVSRLRTISETSTTSQESWSSVVGRERVRTISGTSLYSNSSQCMRDLEEFDWEAWNSQSEVPANEELDYTWNQVSFAQKGNLKKHIILFSKEVIFFS